jgi:hypothetical protein
MAARWGTFAIGLGLLLAPLVLGYASAAAILRDVSVGTLVCVAALAALQWPRVRAVNVLGALWLLLAARRTSDARPAAVELGAAVLLVAASLLPRARRAETIAGAQRANA